MTTVTARDGYSHEAFADVRQRAREQRMRVAAPEQASSTFSTSSSAVRLAAQGMVQQFFEMIGLLLLPPHSRRAPARAAMRVRVAAAAAQVTACVHASMCIVLMMYVLWACGCVWRECLWYVV